MPVVDKSTESTTNSFHLMVSGKDYTAEVLRRLRNMGKDVNDPDALAEATLAAFRKGPSKTELLEHYAQSEPCAFVQYDGFISGGDDVMHADKDGHCLMGGKTYELMSGAYAVRVLVRPDVSRETAHAILRKIAGWVGRRHPLEFPDECPF